jgi:hypothetical protein
MMYYIELTEPIARRSLIMPRKQALSKLQPIDSGSIPLNVVIVALKYTNFPAKADLSVPKNSG